jgi:hypothetical protein
MSALKKGRSEARHRADFRTRGRVRERFSVESTIEHEIVTLTAPLKCDTMDSNRLDRKGGMLMGFSGESAG